MNFLKAILNFLFNKKTKSEIKESDAFFYSYIFNNDSVWLFYKKHNFTEKNINLKISF